VGARPARSLKDHAREAHNEQKPTGQEQARGRRAHGSRAIGDSGAAEDDASQENADHRHEEETPRSSLGSGGLGPDEPHRDDSPDGRTRQSEGRASLAFGVKSRTPTSEALAERENLRVRLSCQRRNCIRLGPERQRDNFRSMIDFNRQSTVTRPASTPAMTSRRCALCARPSKQSGTPRLRERPEDHRGHREATNCSLMPEGRSFASLRRT
jgi:hypothetical protein